MKIPQELCLPQFAVSETFHVVPISVILSTALFAEYTIFWYLVGFIGPLEAGSSFRTKESLGFYIILNLQGLFLKMSVHSPFHYSLEVG